MINKKFFLLLCLVACEEDDKQSIFTSEELLSYESEQHIQVFDPRVNSNNKLDILLVIDNSGSMLDPQAKLAANLEPLLKYIKGSDWQIAITSSDTRDGIVKIINNDNQSEFKSTIDNLGVDGIGNEAVLVKAIQALKGHYLPNNDLGLEDTQIHEDYISCLKREDCYPIPTNPIPDRCWNCMGKKPQFTRIIGGCKSKAEEKDKEPKHEHWLRDGSMLAILLVTDEDHQCHDQVFGCTINDFYFYLKSIREPGATAHVYGLLGDKNDMIDAGFIGGNRWFTEWRDEDGEELFGPENKHVASIRDDNYTGILEDISRSIATSIGSKFTLDHAYDGKGNTSVTFIYGGGKRRELTEAGYRFEGRNTLVLIEKPPNDIEEIEVSYSYGK